MRIISLTILFLLISINAYAVIPIYCPECKIHLYDYQYDVIVNNAVFAKDFKPVGDIPQPTENSEMDCPICKHPLNGWEYYAHITKHKSFTNMCGAISVLTKDELGFKWIPYDVPGTEYTREK
jgi:hypothetical protein